jgi:RpiR family transcriptional regulator, carbohydrate utilization regulator
MQTVPRVVPRVTTDPLGRIKEQFDALPAAQRQVGRVFLDDPQRSIRANVEELARRADVSAPTVVRFCRTLGYDGLSDCKLQLAQSLGVGTPYLHRAVRPKDNAADVIHKIVYGAAAVLTNLDNCIDTVAVEAATRALASARRIDCYSVGFISTFLANDAQARLSRLGRASNAYFDAHMQLISAASLTPRDVVLAISHVGRMPTLLDAVSVAREQGATVIGITQPGTPLALQSTIPLTVVVPEDAVVRVGTEACLAGLILNEILMVGVGLLLGPAAIDGLTRIRDVLSERGIDTDGHPALQWAWSKAERDAVAPERESPG